VKTIVCAIKGISALLMHAYPLIPVEGLEKMTPADQAEHSAYRDPDSKSLYIPDVNIQRSLVAAATFSKGKGRASLQKVVAASVFVSPERVDLGTKEYVVDSRPVVIASTRGRIVRHRPRLDTWQCEFSIEFDDLLVTEIQLRRVVDDAGRLVGLLDFRPACKGPFGRFIVTKWECA
jgi:hypothetical protein